jgi:Tfp pilus assembly protein PilN
MIKVNLVPLKEKKKQQEFVIIFFVSIISAVLAFGMIWIYLQRVQVKRDLNAQIKQVDEESKAYQDKIAEIKDLQAKEANLESTKKNIKSIQEVQRKVIFALDQLAVNLPMGVWLTSIGQGADKDSNKFTVAGYSLSMPALRSYMTALQQNKGFLKDTTFDIKSVLASIGGNKQAIQFEMSIKVADQNP